MSIASAEAATQAPSQVVDPLPPMTLKEVKQTLIEEFCRALKTRPKDFTRDESYLRDSKTSQVWWIRSRRSFFLHDPFVLRGFSFWQKHRVWWHLVGWTYWYEHRDDRVWLERHTNTLMRLRIANGPRSGKGK